MPGPHVQPHAAQQCVPELTHHVQGAIHLARTPKVVQTHYLHVVRWKLVKGEGGIIDNDNKSNNSNNDNDNNNNDNNNNPEKEIPDYPKSMESQFVN